MMLSVYLVALALLALRAGREAKLAPATDPHPWLDALLWAGLLALGASAWILPGPITGALGIGAAALIALPDRFARFAARRGKVRLAYGLGRLQSSRDSHGVGLIWAARAAVTANANREWIDREIDRVGASRAHHLIASAVSHDGSRPRLRALFSHLIANCDSVDLAPAVRAYCVEWLVLDAAESAAWSEVGTLAEGTNRPTTMTRLAVTIAARRVAAHGTPRSRLARLYDWAMWIVAGAPRSARHLVTENHPARPRQRPSTESNTLAGAESIHAPLSPASLDRDIVALADHLEQVLSDGDGNLFARATELGVRDHERLRRELRADLVQQLKALCERYPVAVPARPPRLLEEALADRREAALRELEAVAAALGRRVAARRAHPATLELGEFLALTAVHGSVLARGGPALRRVAFPVVNDHLSAQAIWLWNDRGERFVAREIFRWLHAEAMAAGDAQALETHGHNRDLSVY